MSAVRTLSLVPDTDDLAKAHAAGERAERVRIVAYLLRLAGDDSYEHEGPEVIANQLLCGLHRCGTRG